MQDFPRQCVYNALSVASSEEKELSTRMDKGKMSMTQIQIDAAVERAPARAGKGKSPVYSTPESIQQGEEIMAQARINAAHNLAKRIKCGEFIPLTQLQAAWLVERSVINEALADGRLFAVISESNETYYPAFYIDSSLDRGALEEVCKALGSLPAAVKYYFFTTKFTYLGESPLEALRAGRVKQVLAMAAGYADS